MAFFLIIFGLFLLGDAVWLWWADRRLTGLRRAKLWRPLSAVFTLTMLGSFAWWVGARQVGSEVSPPIVLMSLVMVWHLLVLPAVLVALLLRGAVRAPVWLIRTFSGGPKDRAAAVESPVTDARSYGPPLDAGEALTTPTAPALSRRQFLGATAAAVPPLLAFGVTGAGYWQMSDFRVRRLTIPIASLPPALDGLTIAHVSDTHVGRFTRGKILDRIVQTTNDLDVDLVLFTGDLINDSNDDLPAAIDMAKKMRARAGVWLCEGNHDLIDDGAYFEREVRRSGLNLLLNEHASVPIKGHDVQLIGLTWGPPGIGAAGRWQGGDAALKAGVEYMRPRLDPKALSILLAHHPHALDYAADAGIPLTLAGHTHGGQLMLSSTIGPGSMMYRYWSGLYTKPNGSAVVVSNGVGNWFPVRLNAPAEIIHLTLTRSA